MSFQEAGLAVGGEDFNPYVMLEVHYNNEKKESGEPFKSLFYKITYMTEKRISSLIGS